MTTADTPHECRRECFAGYDEAGSWAQHIEDYNGWEIR